MHMAIHKFLRRTTENNGEQYVAVAARVLRETSRTGNPARLQKNNLLVSLTV